MRGSNPQNEVCNMATFTMGSAWHPNLVEYSISINISMLWLGGNANTVCMESTSSDNHITFTHEAR